MRRDQLTCVAVRQVRFPALSLASKTTNRLHDLVQGAGFVDEHDCRLQHLEAGFEIGGIVRHHQNRDRRTVARDVNGDLDTVERPRHLHIRKQDIEACGTVEQLGGLVTVTGLHNLEAILPQDFCRNELDEALVYDK